MGQIRRRVKHDLPLEERLKAEAAELRERAANMPRGAEREVLIRRAQQHEEAAHLTEWLMSPAQQLPV